MFNPFTYCHEEWKGLHCVKDLSIRPYNQVNMCVKTINSFFFMNQRLGKICLFSTLPKIMTMHSCTSLTFFNSFASPITMWWDVASMDRWHGGMTMVLHGQLFKKWLLIKKNKVQQCFNKPITSPRIFWVPKMSLDYSQMPYKRYLHLRSKPILQENNPNCNQ